MAKKALCLSGGSARGSFQMGAIKCLFEAYGFRPDIITGTSVGAINGIKLACAPPPPSNDSQAILTAVSNGKPDAQLTQMRELEQMWLAFVSRANFFELLPVFKGTKMAGQMGNMMGGAKAPGPETKDQIMATLKQLGELKAAGVLTDSEFEAKKKELLAKL